MVGVPCAGAGSVRTRDARPRRTQLRRTETRPTTTMPHPRRSRDRKRRADRRRISRKVRRTSVLLLSRAWKTLLVPPIFVAAPVPATSTTVADDGDALTNRKRVGDSVLFAFVMGHMLTAGNGTAAGFTIILTDEKCEETEIVGYADPGMALHYRC